MQFSQMMSEISPNILAKLEDRRREIVAAGGQAVNLSAGTPDMPPDRHVMEALSQASLVPENYQYAIKDSLELLQSAADWYRRRFQVALEPDQICSLYGSQEGIAHIAFPLCDAGDVVLAPNPCYPVFHFGPWMRGCDVQYMPLLQENRYIIDLEGISPSLAHRAKMMIVSYPNNPTTACAPPDFYERLVHFARKYDILVLHDNAYCELVLDGQPGGSFLQTKGAVDVGIEFNSLSKAYNLTGMRMSFALGNRAVIAALSKLRSQIDYGPFPAIQKAAMAVLNGPQDILERNRTEYRLRRDALSRGLREVGWNVPDCDSTMFTWYPIPPQWDNDVDFVWDMIDRAGVIAVPGSSFGSAGKGYVRFALIQPVSVLAQVAQKIGTMLESAATSRC